MDRISILPQPILSHIISYLPAEDAFRTCTLSKLWTSICFSYPNMDFDHGEVQKKEGFESYVYRRLVLHDGSGIKRLSLNVKGDKDYFCHLNAWIRFAVRHNVQELFLSEWSGTLDKLPSCLFTCRSLTVLKLTKINLKSPSVIEFPKLKVLELFFVKFLDDNLTSKLSTACPVLEKFYIDHCSFEKVDSLNISSLSLKFLRIDFHTGCEIGVSTPNLQGIECNGAPPKISTETLSSLVTANFKLNMFRKKEGFAIPYRNVPEILKVLRNITKLTLKGFSYIKDMDLVACLPTYYRLKHLHIYMRPCAEEIIVLMFFLRCSPNLHSLRIEMEMFRNIRDQYWQPPSDVGIVKNLTVVEIKSFEGSEGELQLVRFLIGSASVLEKMEIHYSQRKKEDLESRVRISEKIVSFVRASSKAAISLS